MRSDTDEMVDHGTLTVVDNQVDSSTGTVKLKAEFPNSELQLWPGQFVNIRLLIDTLKQVTVVPTGALQRGPNGTFVYVVDGNTAKMRPVQVRKQDENQTVIRNGIAPGDRVVTTGFSRLTDGAQVSISTGDGTPAPAAAPRGGAGAQPRNGQRPAGAGNGERRQRGNAGPTTNAPQ